MPPRVFPAEKTMTVPITRRPARGALAGALALVVLACTSAPPRVPEPDPTVGAHGGRITVTREFRFETICRSDGVVVLIHDPRGAPIDPQGVSGEVSIEEGAPETTGAPLVFVYRPGAVRTVGHLFAAAPGLRGGSVSIRLEGLPGSVEKSVSYTEAIVPPSSAPSRVPSSAPSGGHGGHH